jgi:hypothetical protein
LDRNPPRDGHEPDQYEHPEGASSYTVMA